jgi:hypothetical protein
MTAVRALCFQSGWKTIYLRIIRSGDRGFCDELDMAGRPCKRCSIDPGENAHSPPDRSGIHSARKIVDSDALPDERAALEPQRRL